MPIAHVNGTAIYYEEHGSDHPLIFIHGLGATHAMWEPQFETFSRWNHVITVDVHDSFDPMNLCQPEVFDRLLGDFLQQIG